MEKSRILGLVLSRGEPEQEPLYRLSEPPIQPRPAMDRSGGDGGPIISRAGRDALFQYLIAEIAGLDDLERLAESEEPKEIEECKIIGERVLSALRLIQEGGIGWGRIREESYIRLSMTPQDLARLVTESQKQLTQLVESERTSWEESRYEFAAFVDARDACTAILNQLVSRSVPFLAGS